MKISTKLASTNFTINYIKSPNSNPASNILQLTRPYSIYAWSSMVSEFPRITTQWLFKFFFSLRSNDLCLNKYTINYSAVVTCCFYYFFLAKRTRHNIHLNKKNIYYIGSIRFEETYPHALTKHFYSTRRWQKPIIPIRDKNCSC